MCRSPENRKLNEIQNRLNSEFQKRNLMPNLVGDLALGEESASRSQDFIAAGCKV